jgi:hypothetical protein
MEIKLDPFSNKDEVSRLEKAIRQLPPETFVREGRGMAKMVYWQIYSVVVVRVDYKDITKQVIPPVGSVRQTVNLDSVTFGYKGESYSFFYEEISKWNK